MLGQKIKRLRLQKGISQQELIQGLFDRSYLSQIERGLKVPPRETIEILANRLGVPSNHLTEYGETIQRAAELIQRARETKDIYAFREAWHTAASVHAIEQMAESAIEWSYIASASDATSVELLEAINYTILLISSVDEAFDFAFNLRMVRANTYYYLGMFDQAIWAYRDLEERRPPNELLGRVKVSLGSSLMALMRYEEALDQFANALEVRDITELTRARAHQGVGACCRHLDRWTEAISHLEQACALFAVQKQHYRYILTLHNIGVLWLDKLQFEKAQELFEEVQSFYLNHKMYLNHAELCEEFARIAFYKQNYTLCNEWCNRGIDLLNGQNGPLAGRLFIWKSWCSHVTQYTDTATDAWRVAKCLLGSQLKKTIETFDPNMTEETKEMFYKQI